MTYRIADINDAQLDSLLQTKIDQKTKPPGALGRLEDLAKRIGLIQRSVTPQLRNPIIAVFAADHGICAENVSAFPAEVTAQMVQNFLAGGAAINVFARLNEIQLKVVDAGVKFDFSDQTGTLIDAKIAPGTANFAVSPAMNAQQCEQAMQTGARLVGEWHADNCNVIGFGEMGIGNTSAAAVLTSVYADRPLEECVGAGTGLDREGVDKKLAVLKRALARTGLDSKAIRAEPLLGLREYGGFEIAMMCGAILRGAELRMLVLIDGFIATSAALVCRALAPEVLQYCVLTHCSAERGHSAALEALQDTPLLDLGMRLGEGTGAAVAYPIVQAAAGFLNEMSSFADANVSGKKT